MVNLLKIWYNFQMDRYQKLINGKAKKKRELLGKMFFPRTPVALIDLSKLADEKSLKDLVEGLCAIHVVSFVVLPDGLGKNLPENNYIHYVKPEEKNNIYEAADFVVTENGGMKSAWKNGCVPVAQLDGTETLNYNPLCEKGNGFYFKEPTKWEIFAAIVRALETYQFPYDWENLIREILKK